jgi:release factor glutamine methyltransferase
VAKTVRGREGVLAAVVTRVEVVASVAQRLGSPQEAHWLVDDVLGRLDGQRRATRLVTPAQLVRIDDKVERRLAGEPLQYVLGSWAFRTLDLLVDPRVLIPRPETEQVVEAALSVLAELRAAYGGEAPALVACDLGTGSGAIALALAVEVDGPLGALTVWATDRDPEALEVAARNRDRIGMEFPAAAERVRLRHGEWFEALPAALAGRISLVVSNPPYVAHGEWADLDPEVRAEPPGALLAADGEDGTPGVADVVAVLRGSAEWLARPGAVVIELAPHQAEMAAQTARGLGFCDVRLTVDLAGRHRGLVGWLR